MCPRALKESAAKFPRIVVDGGSHASERFYRSVFQRSGSFARGWRLCPTVRDALGVSSLPVPRRATVVSAGGISKRDLAKTGYVDGQAKCLIRSNIGWAENQYDQLPDMASDLIRRHCGIRNRSALYTGGCVLCKQKVAGFQTISDPCCFHHSSPIRPFVIGLVDSLANRPGGNVTGAAR